MVVSPQSTYTACSGVLYCVLWGCLHYECWGDGDLCGEWIVEDTCGGMLRVGVLMLIFVRIIYNVRRTYLRNKYMKLNMNFRPMLLDRLKT